MTIAEPVEACVFDAYGTLFDVSGVTRHCADVLGETAEPLAELWRTKQLEYTWLRSLRGDYLDFWHVTGESLDYAMAAHGIEDDALRSRLMEAYLAVEAYTDVAPTLQALRQASIRTAILSNGNLSMIIAALHSAGLADIMATVISADEAGIYKPHPDVYKLAEDHLRVSRKHIAFVSSNPWDVSGAAHFGFRVVWVNRRGLPPDRLPGQPETVIASLAELPGLLAKDGSDVG